VNPISNQELELIRHFENNCNEMINGKFILADIKIAKILKSIAVSKAIYSYLAECLLNFDFVKEFDKAKGIEFSSAYFRMPEEDYKKVALVFCLLVEIDNKKLDFYDFVNKYFKTNNEGDEYALFTRTMLIPFRDGIMKNFNLFDAPSEVEEEIKAECQNIVDVKIEVIKHLQSMLNITQISPKINSKDKEQLKIVLTGLIEAVQLKNKKILFALEIALANAVSKVKHIKDMYNELIDKLIELYKEI
jgi:hypothetical protein